MAYKTVVEAERCQPIIQTTFTVALGLFIIVFFYRMYTCLTPKAYVGLPSSAILLAVSGYSMKTLWEVRRHNFLATQTVQTFWGKTTACGDKCYSPTMEIDYNIFGFIWFCLVFLLALTKVVKHSNVARTPLQLKLHNGAASFVSMAGLPMLLAHFYFKYNQAGVILPIVVSILCVPLALGAVGWLDRVVSNSYAIVGIIIMATTFLCAIYGNVLGIFGTFMLLVSVYASSGEGITGPLTDKIYFSHLALAAGNYFLVSAMTYRFTQCGYA